MMRIPIVFTVVGLVLGYPNPQLFAQESIQSLCGSEVVRVDNTWTVAATGTDDTYNIQCALDEGAASGVSAIVQLESDDYFIGTSISVADFNGVFRGTGMGLTRITTIEDAVFPASRVGSSDWSWGFLFQYNASTQMHLTISDLTFHAQSVTEPFLHHGTWVNWIGQAFWILDNADLGDSGVARVDVDFENVEVYGNTNDPRFDNILTSDGRSLLGSLGINGMDGDGLSGTFNIRGNYLHDQALAVAVLGVTDSTVTIGGNPKDANLFEDVVFTANQVAAVNSQFVVSHNRTVNAALIDMIGSGIASSYVVSHNVMNTFMGWEGISFWDFDDGSFASIENNDITVTTGSVYGYSVIFGARSENVRIVNNTLHGSGYAPGVMLALSRNVDLRVNDFSSYYGFGYPDVWLSLFGDPYYNSSDCSVIGSSPASTIVWGGVPGENLLVNVNYERGRLDPPGAEIRPTAEELEERSQRKMLAR